MMRKHRLTIALLALFLLILAGCSGKDRNEQIASPQTPFTITATLPHDLAQDVPRTGNVVFHFNREIAQDSVRGAITFEWVRDDSSRSDVPARVNAVGTNVYITPLSPLAPSTDFTVSVSDQVRSVDGTTPVLEKASNTLSFSTRPLRAQAFLRPFVTGMSPDPSTDFISDAATFRLFFSEPIDEASVNYGTTVELSKDGFETVPAMVFALDNQIVIDPDADLDATASYTLVVRGVTDRNGETQSDPFEVMFQVTATQPSSSFSSIFCPTTGVFSTEECPPESNTANLPLSAFTGDPVNSLVLDSTLLGNTTMYLSGRLVTELGNPAVSEQFVPIVIRKGQVLYGKGFEPMLGGKIGTGLETGDVTLQILTDATGVLSGSGFAFGVEGQQSALSVHLDVGLNALDSDPAANAMMAQSVLGMQLSGTVFVVDGKLIMEATGFSEITFQGETIPVILSLRTASQAVAELDIKPDVIPPRLRSTTPEHNASRVRLAERIVGNFDEPLDPQSVQGNFYLETVTGARISASLKTLGARVVLSPNAPLAANTEYQIVAAAGLSDIQGNVTATTQSYRFTTGANEATQIEDNPPLLTATSPSPADQVGFPAQFPLILCFNQLMDPNTIRLGDTLRVRDLTAGYADVRGTIYHRGNTFVFEPNEMWSAGHTYQVTLSDQITNLFGLELDLDGDREPGGSLEQPELSFDFYAIQENHWVMQILKLDPIVDTDGSGFVEGNEIGTDINTLKMNFPFFDQPGFVRGHLIAWIKGINDTQYNVPFVEVDIDDGSYLLGTSINASLFKSDTKGLFDPMGRITIDVIQTGIADITEGYGNTPLMNFDLKTRFNFEDPFYDEAIYNVLNLKPKGVLSFSSDGRLVADITGKITIRGSLPIPLIDFDLPLWVPTELKLRAVGEPLPYY